MAMAILDARGATAKLHRLAVELGSKSTSAAQRVRLPCPIPPALLDALKATLPELSPHQIARQAWALGRVSSTEARRLLAGIAARVTSGGFEGHAQYPAAVASVAWALATTLRRRSASSCPAASTRDCSQLDFPGSAAATCLARMRPQDAANTLWAAATLRCGAPLHAPLAASVIATHWAPRDVAVALWAYATAQSAPPGNVEIRTLCEAAARSAGSANGQDIANSLWAMATLGGAATRRSHICALADAATPTSRLRTTGGSCGPPPKLRAQELANGVWALASCGVHHAAFFALVRSQLSKPAARAELARADRAGDLLANVVWAFSVARHLLGRRGGHEDVMFLKQLREAMLEHGAALDASRRACCSEEVGCVTDKSVGQLVSRKAEDEFLPHGYMQEALEEHSEVWYQDAPSDLPRVVRRIGDISIVYKPPSWEVDGRSSRSGEGGLPAKKRMSAFVFHALPDSATASDTASEHGFLHRLDAPSSGLLLRAESYVALMELRWQQDTLGIDREYLALVHGSVDEPATGGVLQFDGWLAAKGVGSIVATDGAGRPARTLARPIALLSSSAATVRKGAHRLYTLLAVRIVTGRKHQIRAHLSAIGHPVVCDGRYGRQHLEEDRRWCGQNFLHRYRLGFNDAEGERHEVVEPLPQHLRRALAALEPTPPVGACAENTAAAISAWAAAAEWASTPKPFHEDWTNASR